VGAKSDPDDRLDAIDNAFKAGIDDIGIGPLLEVFMIIVLKFLQCLRVYSI
jgi:hypothetical protein